MRSGWGKVDYPQVVGHEIVGTAIKVGKNVKDIKVYTPFYSFSDMADLTLAPFDLRLATWSASVLRVTLAASAIRAASIRSRIVLKVLSVPTTVSTSVVQAKGTRHTEE